MPNDPSEPIPGRCNAKRPSAPGHLCRNRPHNPRSKTNTRCKHHGGMSTGPTSRVGKAISSKNAVKHGLYANMLRDSLEPEDRAIWDELDGATDLTQELKLARMRLGRYTRLRATLQDPELSEERKRQIVAKTIGVTVDLGRLEIEAMDLIRRITIAQNDMHPETKMQGRLRVSVTVSSAGKAAGDAFPDIDGDDAEATLESLPAEAEGPADEGPAPSPLGEFES